MDVPVAGASPANRPCLRCDSKVNTPNLVEKADTNMNIRKGHVQWGQCYDRGHATGQPDRALQIIQRRSTWQESTKGLRVCCVASL
ncbi:uncharacterized protein LOC144286304 isoform X3 [Canis aureus]